MALSEWERQVMLMNLRIDMVPEKAPAWTVRDFFDCVKAIYDAGAAATTIGADVDEEGEVTRGDNPLSIADFKVGTDGTLTLLFHHTNKRAPDPALMHIPTRRLWTAGKGDEDGVAHGAHLVIAASRGIGKSHVPALLERIPGVGRALVLGFLNTMVRKECQARGTTFIDPDSVDIRRCHPKLAFNLPVSASLKEDLQNGRINRIEFVKSAVEGGLDEEGVIHPTTVRLVHEVNGKLPLTAMYDLYVRSKLWGRTHGYEEMQVRYTRQGAAHSPKVRTDQSDAEDALYGRHEEINNFVDKLVQCPAAVVDEVLTKMHALFDKPALWR